MIEVLVALVLFEFGIMALMLSSALTARDLGDANRRLRARWLANDRVEQLRVTACATASAGTARAPGGLTEFWRIEIVGDRRVAVDSVEIRFGRDRREHLVVRSWVLCRA